MSNISKINFNGIDYTFSNEEYVTPEMFGAVGDGITDDSEAIQQALNESLFVMFSTNKTYKCSNLIVRSNHDINLNGATLYTDENASIFVCDSSDGSAVNRIHIYNGNLKGNSENNSKTNQRLINLACFYSVFENIRFSNCYEGIYLRSRTNSNISTVENVFKELKFNNCYYCAFETDESGNATDGRINGMFISCPSGSSFAMRIGKSAGWLIDNIHVYGATDGTFVSLRSASHTFLNNAYIEGNYAQYGLSVNLIGSFNLSNTTIVAINNNSTMLTVSKNTSEATTKRIVNCSNLTLECNVDEISVNSITGTVDKFYASGLTYNNPFDSISKPTITVSQPVIGTMRDNYTVNVVDNGTWFIPLYCTKSFSGKTISFDLPVNSTFNPYQIFFELDIYMKPNHTQTGFAHGKYKGEFIIRNSTNYLFSIENSVDGSMTSLTVTESNGTITATFESELSSNYGMACIRVYPRVV